MNPDSRDRGGEALDWKPSHPARDRPHIALIVETSLASGRDIVRGIARYVREHGPWSIYFEPRSLEDLVPSWLDGWDGDGIIARLQNAQIADAVVATGLPAVDVLGVVRRPQLPLAHVDNGAIARLAARHFLERGFRHFGFCGINGLNWSDQRRDAFVRAVGEAGGECLIHALPTGQVTWESEQDHLADWVRTLPRPCAVMACNDPWGQKVLEACRRSGVKVPHEVAVIGVDNDEPICFISDPPLSSVVPNHERVGYEAAALLDRARAGNIADDTAVYIPPEAVVTRQSSDVLALTDPEVAEAIYFIRENACRGVGVDEVCQHVSLSRSTLQRRFRRLLDSTILDELINARVGRAREMLAQTDLPIALIAERCGFGHQEYLGKVFRERIGQTPAGLRKRARSIRPGN
ncbi:substrate-binding domain-containing protein [Tundrisphaera sp. TA3]|uniref:XylR family transcriptional regulator n=1 Tax=Tundrisphaera sp. TA3 TaxID=3435775 RepID=UPI003EBBB1E5